MAKSGCVNSGASERLGRKELSVLWDNRAASVLWGCWEQFRGALALVLRLHGIPEEPVWDGMSQLCSTG